MKQTRFLCSAPSGSELNIDLIEWDRIPLGQEPESKDGLLRLDAYKFENEPSAHIVIRGETLSSGPEGVPLAYYRLKPDGLLSYATPTFCAPPSAVYRTDGGGTIFINTTK